MNSGEVVQLVFGLGVTSTVTLLTVVWWFLRQRQTFWHRHRIPCAPDPHLLYGNVRGILSQEHSATILERMYRDFKARGLAAGGFNLFFSPALLVIDPNLARRILVDDFEQFQDRGIYASQHADPLSGTLFALQGQGWETMRQHLTPAFDSSSVRRMFPATGKVADELRSYVKGGNAARQRPEWTDLLARYTTDVIGTCAFGIRSRTIREPYTNFRAQGQRAFAFSIKRMWKYRFGYAYRWLADLFRLRVTRLDVERFFLDLCRATVLHRESYRVAKDDFLQLMMALKDEDKLQMTDVAVQCFTFLVAGFETSASLMSFCLYELAKHTDVQDRLRKEINGALDETDGQLSYEMIMTLTYLDQVVNETLRLYPPVDYLFRVSKSAYRIPDVEQQIPAGTLFLVPVYAFHRDAAYHPDPDSFLPDRFHPATEAQRTPSTFLPFGDGPRSCIGARFGLMQVKIGLATLLRSFRFTHASSNRNVTFKPRSLVLAPSGGMYLNVEPL